MKKDLPKHVAIIMDGNGRWATQRGLLRTFGHREGARRVEDITTECRQLGIRYLTLYAFSTENWKRPSFEVNILMHLLVEQLRIMRKKLIENEISLISQGSLENLPEFVRAALYDTMEVTKLSYPRMYLNLCLSYGGRQEICYAVKKIASQVAEGKIQVDQITEQSISDSLYHPEIPDPDLLIRTGGEYRVSNFLLWQIAYSEIYVSPTLWPDFNEGRLHDALSAYQDRERRFGHTSEQIRGQSEGDRP